MNSVTSRECRLYVIAAFSVLISLGALIFGVDSNSQRGLAIQQASTAKAEQSFAVQQMATTQANVEEAKTQATISRANELAAQSSAERNTNLQRAMLLGIEAYRIDKNARTKSALFDNARADPSIQLFLGGHTSASTAEFTSDGSILATGGHDGITLWDVKTGQIIRKMEWKEKDDFVTSLVFSRDGSVLASISHDNFHVALWDVSTGKLLEKQPPVEKRYVYAKSVLFSPTEDIVAISSSAGRPVMSPYEVNQTMLWNFKTGQTIETLEIGAPFISFSPDGNILGFTGQGKNSDSATLWDIENHRVYKILSVKYLEGVKPLMFFTDGTLLAGDKIWDVNTGQPIRQSLDVSYESVFSLDGNTMFIPNKGDITALNMESGEERLFARFSEQSGLRILAVSPNGNLLAVSGMYSGNMMLAKKYDLFQPLGRLLAAIADPYKFTDRLVFTPDGQTLTAASPPAWGVTMQWDVQSGQLIENTVSIPDFLPNSKPEVYSRDGNIKASIDFENDTIVIWDAKLGKKIRTLDLEGAQLWQSLALSPDGKTLAAKDFLELVLWDVESGQNIGESLKLTGEEMVFSPNGKLMATTGVGYVVLWDMDPQSWLEQTCERVGRNLTILEWEKYFPGEKYRVTCPQWPPAPGIYSHLGILKM